jgi:class 3 adenylate cyclase/tetratricopeptide (TPR) repeat protein
METCAQCGAEGLAGFRFCGVCGAPLATRRDAARQTRKVVTALFCDTVGSTALGEELDPEVLDGILSFYFQDIRATIERHGGTVEKFIGDAVMAVFGIPRVHEDDALRAVRAAAEIRDRLPALGLEVGVPLRFRTGINTGTVLMGEGENLAIGDAVNVAARFEQAAAPGEIVMGAETLRLVRDAVEVDALEPLELKGKSAPVAAYRLLTLDPSAPGIARHLDAALIGRERELRLLHEAWERVVGESGCHLLTLLGPAGVGKSRLIAELLAGIEGRAMILRGRCLPYGEGITFWPLIEALGPVGEAAQPVIDRLSGGGAAVPQELFWEVRRLLESLAAQRPLALYVDDLQWAEPMLLDLLDHVVDLSRGEPILLLCSARPELLEDRGGWGGGKLNAASVLLEPLGPEAAASLLKRLGDGLDEAAQARIVRASEGNPLFLEEMAALAREGGTTSVPPTIQALLSARLERLAVEERELLERGAVEGEVFHRLALRALAEGRLVAELEPRLAALVRKELIRPHPAMLEDDDAFRFRHLLIRDAAYDGLPKATRADLHERFAGWLEEQAAALPEFEEIVGWHLEQAVRYGLELGREPDPAVADRAAERLHTAGRRAGDRSDNAAARNLLGRALALARPDGLLRATVAVDLADRLSDVGEYDRVDELLSIGEREPELAGMAALLRFEWTLRMHPEESLGMFESLLPDLLDGFQRAGDERGIARAHMSLCFAHWLKSRATPAGEHAALAAEHARRAGDEGMRARALGFYLGTLMLGSINAAQIAAEADAIEDEAEGAVMNAWLDTARGRIADFAGRFDEAERLISRAQDAMLDMGMKTLAGGQQMLVARIRRRAGDHAGALAALQEGDKILADLDERSYRSTTQAMIAEEHAALGDRSSALVALEFAENLGAAEDMINYALIHGVHAGLALAEGDHEAAERWARSALDYADETDFFWPRAEAKAQLARVLVATGRVTEGARELRDAEAIYRAKGDVPGVANVQELIATL